MNKLTWTFFVVAVLTLSLGLSSCIETGDEERPGMYVNTDLFLTKVWKVSLFSDDGQDKTILFGDVFIEFRENFIFRITKGCDVIEGEWILSSDSTLLVIRVPDTSSESLKQLEDEWVVTWLTDNEMHFVEQDNKGDEEFHLSVAPLPALNCATCDNLMGILTDSVWSITSFITGANDLTEESRGSYLDFSPNGEVVLYTDYEENVGLWAVTDQCQLIQIQWLDDQLIDDFYSNLEDSWFIKSFDNTAIFLESESSSNLQITKGRIPDCETTYQDLLNTSWSIDYMSINEDDVSDNFLGTGFTFLEDNQLATEVIIGPAILGGWTIEGECNQLTLNIQAGQLKELSRAWVITSMEPDVMVLVFEEGTLRMEMHWRTGKPQVSDQCADLLDYLLEESWDIEKFTNDDQPSDHEIEAYHLIFNADGSLIVYDADTEITGRWYPSRNCQYLVVEIDKNSPAHGLSGTWEIEKREDQKIKLVYDKMSKRKTLELIKT
jgi:hypothetical protein